MTQKIRVVIGTAAFALLIAGAVLAYDALRGAVAPEVRLAEQPAEIVATPKSADDPAADQDQTPEPEKTKAPDFTAEDADGNPVKLSDMIGKPVVLNFWASWCPPCKAEMPEFERVYAELGDQVVFMMVNMTDGGRETRESGAAYAEGEGFSFPVYYDVAQEAANAYGIRSIPTTIFIDADGYVVTGAEGQIDEQTLRYGVSLIQTGGDGAGDASS